MKPQKKTLQGWVNWAEFIDNNSDSDGSQWDKELLDKQKVIEVIEKHFVHGYTGDGTVHSSNCRMCKLLKELGLDE